MNHESLNHSLNPLIKNKIVWILLWFCLKLYLINWLAILCLKCVQGTCINQYHDQNLEQSLAFRSFSKTQNWPALQKLFIKAFMDVWNGLFSDGQSAADGRSSAVVSPWFIFLVCNYQTSHTKELTSNDLHLSRLCIQNETTYHFLSCSTLSKTVCPDKNKALNQIAGLKIGLRDLLYLNWFVYVHSCIWSGAERSACAADNVYRGPSPSHAVLRSRGGLSVQERC